MAEHRLRSRRALRLTAIGATAALLTALPQAVSAAPVAACDTQSNNTYQKLLECMTGEGVTEHLEAFQKIAENNPDPEYGTTRAAGTPGYQASVDYVAGLLEDAGYTVTLDPVEITYAFIARAAPAHAGPRRLRDRGLLRQWRGRRHRQRRPGRHQPHAAAGEHERVRRRLHRGGGRIADRGGPRRYERLRRLPRREHRAHPAGWLQLRAQGPERRGSRRIRRHHLQPGQHARPRGACSSATRPRRRGAPTPRSASPSSAPASRTAPPSPSRVRRRTSR